MRVLVAVVAVVAVACSGGRTPAPATTTSRPSTTTTTATPTTTTTTTTVPTTTTLPTVVVPPPENPGCEPVPDPDGSHLRCRTLGLEIVASSGVDPDVLVAAAERVERLLSLPGLAEAFVGRGVAIRILRADESILEVPGFEDLYRRYPGTDWRREGRWFPGTTDLPVVVGAEENLSCLEGDRFAGEDMLVKALAFAVRRFGLVEIAPELDRAIEVAYAAAVAAGRWRDTLAETNSDQWWGEGTQSYFGVNREADPPDSSHNAVDTPEELQRYDPDLFGLARRVWGEPTPLPACS